MSSESKPSDSRSKGLWDGHVHCYPAEVIADPAAWADSSGEEHWDHLVSNGPQGWAGPDDLLRRMDGEGIETVLLQAWYWQHPDTCRRQNDWHASWLQRYPGRFKACAAIHPEMEDPETVLKEARSWGACAVGECLPGVQCEAGWQHPGWEPILAWTTAAGWPLCLHLTEPVGHSYPGRVETCLMETVALFEEHPQQKWLCAHWGGGLPFHSLNRRVRKALRRVWFDTAASPLLYDSRIWRTVCDLVGAEKIVLGSDFPLLLYPRREQQPSWRSFLAEFRDSGLTPYEQEQIGGRNLRRLLGCHEDGSSGATA